MKIFTIIFSIILLSNALLHSKELFKNRIIEHDKNYIEFTYKDHTFKFFDSAENSRAAYYICKEIFKGHYDIKNLNISKNDVMIDIGAHVGMISILYAKLYPELTIYAFEPMPRNYKTLIKNIELNNVTNVIPHNLAITKDGRDISMVIGLNNTGGATQCLNNIHLGENHENAEVSSLTLNEVFERYKVSTCKVLKVDCEGSEYEILLNTNVLSSVENIIGEFHINDFLKNQGYTIPKLIEHCKSYGIAPKVQKCNMHNA